MQENGHPLEILAGLKPRPAEPHATNAPLSTPGGSRVVAYQSSPIKPPPASQEAPSASQESPAKKRKAKELVPPDVGAIPAASTDIDRLLKDAEAYLVKVDPKLKGLIEKHHCKMFSPEGLREVVDPFTALSSGIIGQQVCEFSFGENGLRSSAVWYERMRRSFNCLQSRPSSIGPSSTRFEWTYLRSII